MLHNYFINSFQFKNIDAELNLTSYLCVQQIISEIKNKGKLMRIKH